MPTCPRCHVEYPPEVITCPDDGEYLEHAPAEKAGAGHVFFDGDVDRPPATDRLDAAHVPGIPALDGQGGSGSMRGPR